MAIKVTCDPTQDVASTGIVKMEIVSVHVLKYDLREAFEAGVKDHPQTQMKKLGYTPTKAIPESIGDCWFFEVSHVITPMPVYLELSTYEFKE